MEKQNNQSGPEKQKKASDSCELRAMRETRDCSEPQNRGELWRSGELRNREGARVCSEPQNGRETQVQPRNLTHRTEESGFAPQVQGETDRQTGTQSRCCIAIDLKSYYASVECVARHMDPLTTNLVVADASRTEKTICLAVSPSLKSYGLPGRARLFEVEQKVKEINIGRRWRAPGKELKGSSVDNTTLQADSTLALDFVVAKPQMALYMEVSRKIYSIYLRYIAPGDIHVYSVDEVFIDATAYLKTYDCTPRELAMKLIHAVLEETGITATAGVGTNLYLCKVAMDIMAKRQSADEDGVRVAELDEMSYRRQLWDHKPLTDFWRVGAGTAKKLAQYQIFTMGDLAECSVAQAGNPRNAELLYRLFGVNAELLIDHAWGWEPCTMEDIHSYRPQNTSLSTAQVLAEPYDAEKGLLIVKEMTDRLVLDMVEKGLRTSHITLMLHYDAVNLKDEKLRKDYSGEICTNHYGRPVPKPTHGSVSLKEPTSSTRRISEAVVRLYKEIVDPKLMIRRVGISVSDLVTEEEAEQRLHGCEQLSLFEEESGPEAVTGEPPERELRRQQAILAIQKKYGKNAMLKGMNLSEGATAVARNGQIGGHSA